MYIIMTGAGWLLTHKDKLLWTHSIYSYRFTDVVLPTPPAQLKRALYMCMYATYDSNSTHNSLPHTSRVDIQARHSICHTHTHVRTHTHTHTIIHTLSRNMLPHNTSKVGAFNSPDAHSYTHIHVRISIHTLTVRKQWKWKWFFRRARLNLLGENLHNASLPS